MIAPIELIGGIPYSATMQSVALRLLALVALLLMPIGMSAALAAANPRHSASAMAMQDCPGSSSKSHEKSGFVECAMACSAALPAVDQQTVQPPKTVRAVAQRALAQVLIGLHPEAATPPPKLS